MKRFIVALSLVASAAIATSARAGDKKAAQADEHGAQVTLEEFKKLVDSKSAVIIDANGADMYADGHVPGAVSFAANEGKLASVLPKDKSAALVAYCGGPMCTAWEFAATEAKKLGYTNIKHFKGGIKGWKEAGMPVEKGVKKSS